MYVSRNFIVLPLVVVACLWTIREYQIHSKAKPAGSIGPDVIVGDIPSIQRWGADADETAFSIGTTSCNIGDQRLDWIADSTLHPVISQNMYRVKNGRIEQLGMSWLKHGFGVAAGNLCNTCTDPAWDYLGVGCSDPYGASLNGSQGGLGPRSEVKASTGVFSWPKRDLPGGGALDGRLRVFTADLVPSQNAGARYFVESQYIHPQDAQSGNGNNNCSYREAFVEPEGSNGWDVEVGSPQTVRQQPAINAWKAIHPDVQLYTVDIPEDGRVIVGVRTTRPQGSALYHTEIAIQNINSHRSIRSLKVDFGPGRVGRPGFRDVDYQFEPYSKVDWTPQAIQSSMTWSTQTFAANQNANAIRWNTLYSFWCDSQAPPRKLTLGLFRLETINEMVVEIAETVEPEDFVVEQGLQSGGQLADIFTSNNSYLQLDPAPTDVLKKQEVSLVVNGTSPTIVPGDFAFKLESSMFGGPVGDVIQTIELFNFDTGEFETVDQRQVRTTDTRIEINPAGDKGRFVHVDTGEVEARINWKTPTGFSGTPFVWSIDVDEAGWIIGN